MRRAEVSTEKNRISIIQEYLKMFLDTMTKNDEQSNADITDIEKCESGRKQELEQQTKEYEEIMQKQFKKMHDGKEIVERVPINENVAKEKKKDIGNKSIKEREQEI